MTKLCIKALRGFPSIKISVDTWLTSKVTFSDLNSLRLGLVNVLESVVLVWAHFVKGEPD